MPLLNLNIAKVGHYKTQDPCLAVAGTATELKS